MADATSSCWARRFASSPAAATCSALSSIRWTSSSCVCSVATWSWNLYSGPPDYGRRARLDSGELGIGAVTNFPTDLDAQMPLSHLRSLHQWTAPVYVIDSDEPIQAGVDGEATVFDPPLTVSVQPKGLRVLVPRGTRPGYASTSELVAARLLDLADTAGIGPR